jgi:Arc/MetJ family transcription regulator
MSRAVIDIDDEKLFLAAQIFGTTTPAATVDAALEDAIKCRKAASAVDPLGLTPPAE